MAKTGTCQDLLLGPRKKEQELWSWLYTEIRAAILDGRLKPGTRLPSSRNLADQYGLSRGTVVASFNQLRAEGYATGEGSAGTFVNLVETDHSSAIWKRRLPASRTALSKRATKLISKPFLLPDSHSIGRAFRSYEPAIDLFPVELWARVAARVYRNAPLSLYGQGDPSGYQPLRRAIAEYVGRSRGVRCSAEQIIVTTGAQQAFDLISRLLLDPGDEVWMEDPGYPGASKAFEAGGAVVIPVPVDPDGMDISYGRRVAPRARMAYVTPANQFPLGKVLSAKRKIELLNWASMGGSWIIEDEYDGEYRYLGKPIASMHSMDRSGSVIYVGTFTKLLFNALRLGFIVVPERLVEAFQIGRSYIDQHPPTLDQATLAEFITEGHFGNHVRKMRQVYLERLQLLRDSAQENLAGILEVDDPPAGMRTIAWLKTGIPDRVAAQKAKRHGLDVFPISAFVSKYRRDPGLMLGFAGCNANEIKRGVETLAIALEGRIPM